MALAAKLDVDALLSSARATELVSAGERLLDPMQWGILSIESCERDLRVDLYDGRYITSCS